jgi:drug/metabolite transporter (DMT)-like permease
VLNDARQTRLCRQRGLNSRESNVARLSIGANRPSSVTLQLTEWRKPDKATRNPARFDWTAASSCLLYLAVIGSALTFLLLYWLLPRMTVARLQAISLITPPGAVALGWAVGGETFSLWSLLGACLVLAGVWMILRKPEMPEPLIQKVR